MCVCCSEKLPCSSPSECPQCVYPAKLRGKREPESLGIIQVMSWKRKCEFLRSHSAHLAQKSLGLPHVLSLILQQSMATEACWQETDSWNGLGWKEPEKII